MSRDCTGRDTSEGPGREPAGGRGTGAEAAPGADGGRTAAVDRARAAAVDGTRAANGAQETAGGQEAADGSRAVAADGSCAVAADDVPISGAGGAVSPPPGRGRIVAALMLCMALAALDSTIIATAVPQIVGDLGGFAVFSWLFSGYLLAVTVTLPVYGKLSDTFGRKPILITGVIVFLAGSLLCAGAWDMGSLIAFRILQGLGGGALQGTVQTVAADLYPMRERPRIQARLSTVWATSSVAGPALGGLLAAYADWRWIFLVNLPVGALALWLVVRHFRESLPARERDRRPRVDWPGALAVFACGGLLLTALVQGGVAWPWLSAPSLLLLAGSVLCGAATVVIERRATEPIIPGWVWRRRTISAVNLALGAVGLLMVAPTVFLPTYAQAVLGLGPTAAGFVLSAMTLSWPVSSALSSHVYNRIGIRACAMTGVGAATLVLLAFPLLPYPGAAWQPALIMLALGAALGIFQLPLIIGVQSSVGFEERGTATASILFCRQVGQCLGAALFGAVANATLNGRLADAPADIRPGLPGDLDSVSHALARAGALTDRAADYLRRAVDVTVEHVYIGAAVAAGLAFLILLLLAPRRFPVHGETAPGAAVRNTRGTSRTDGSTSRTDGEERGDGKRRRDGKGRRGGKSRKG